MSRSVLAVALVLAAAPLTAQAQDPVLAAVKENWKGMITNVTAAAEEVTEANYSFKPTPEVRSFGQLIGHVAGTQNLICAAVLGDKVPAEDAIEKTAKTKAALVAALKASTAYCDKAYTLAPAKFGDSIEMFGGKQTKIAALTLNAVHDGEHYGNIVTYMRLKGMVPPSSKR
ncbi:MAG: DinB family protein [Gemmatimonadaceae bacterium]|nr:DinB family protein [Gemmatimonadaceae bacterium]